MTGGLLTLLVNPRADRGRARRLAHQAQDVLAQRGGLRVSIPELHTAQAVRQASVRAVQNGDPAIVVVGGDGICHLVIQEIAGTSTALGIIPAGTGNDFAAGLGLLGSCADAASDLADCLTLGLRRTVDLARCGQTWWASVLCAGFDSAVTVRANKMRWPRGPRRYDLALIAELARLRAIHMRLDLDDRSVEVDATLVAVGNTSSYGGGIRICPHADPTDGMLEVTVVGPVSRAELIRVTPNLRRGDHLSHPAVTSYRARTVSMHGPADPPVVASADGEPLQELPVTATCHPSVLHVLQAPADTN